MSNPIKTDTDFLFQLDEFYLDLREDGRSISFLEKKEIEKMPYPGLRPFKSSEFQLFNGRDGQAEELINRLRENHFLAVIGSSGTGKSSLIRAGLIPQLLAGYLQEAGTNWDIAICRPGKDPVANLAVAFARIKCRSNDEKAIKNEFRVAEPLLSRSIYGILDFNEGLNPPGTPKEERSNLLVIVDQFEELFRFNRDDLKKPGVENHFVNLLLNSSLNPGVSIYVIITMRSEFLGDCIKYRGLPEAINKGQYLVPQLSREQIKEVIQDPISLAGKKIDPGLVELLVNEIEESKVKKDLDQLPILQHALMRTYQVAMNKGATEVTYEHYKAAGELKNALAKHAQAKYDKLADGINKESFEQKIAKIIFQALTDASTDQKKGRRPTELEIIYDIAVSVKASRQEVNKVIENFRDTETSFIMPPPNTALSSGLIMDISHESLMRQWDKLKGWVDEEAENGKMLMLLTQYQKLNQKGDKGYMDDIELQRMSKWYKSFNPQDAWAQRYSPDYKESFNYLKESEKKWEEAQKKIESERLRKARRSKILWVTIPSVIFLTAFLVNSYNIDKKAREKTKARLTFLLNKREEALHYERNLQALIYTTEAFMLEKDTKVIDSIIKLSLHPKSEGRLILPAYSLRRVYLNPENVNDASISLDGKTIFIWVKNNTFSELNIESGKVLKSRKYEDLDEKYEALVRLSKRRLFFNSKSQLPETRDTVLKDSSIYFKQNFYDSILDKDKFDFYTLPKIIKTIEGADCNKNKTRKLTWLTWGENLESNWAGIELWNHEGITAGISLIHEGINGAAISNDKNLILSWGSDSTVRIWQFTNDTAIIHWPAKLFKMKVQIDTGVEMNKEDYSIKIIPPTEYKKRKEEFLLEYQRYFHKPYQN